MFQTTKNKCKTICRTSGVLVYHQSKWSNYFQFPTIPNRVFKITELLSLVKYKNTIQKFQFSVKNDRQTPIAASTRPALANHKKRGKKYVHIPVSL